MAYCDHCGSSVDPDDSYCEECGTEVVRTTPTRGGKYAGKNRTVAMALAAVLGVFGGHKFYLGELKQGVIYLLFSWSMIPFFLGLYDAYKYYSEEELFEGSVEAAVETTDGPGPTAAESATSPVPDDLVMQVDGVNGSITLFEDRIEISREDIGLAHKLQHGFSGNKEIRLSSISSVQIRKPSTMTRGYIQFGQSGFSESSDGLMDATSDENSVLFEKDSLVRFEELRTKIRDLSTQNVESRTGDMDDGLSKLRERYANGEIEEEEYNRRKDVLTSD